MASNFNECAVCSVRFETYDKLCEHRDNFEREITTLLLRLKSLLVHQWPENRHAEPPDSDSNDEDLSDSDQYSCPHDDCGGHNKLFRRKQDLIRHYGKQRCERCDHIFTRANKFWQHKCATKRPSKQIKGQVKHLRKKTKSELAKRKRLSKALGNGPVNAKTSSVEASGGRASEYPDQPLLNYPTWTSSVARQGASATPTAAHSMTETMQSILAAGGDISVTSLPDQPNDEVRMRISDLYDSNTNQEAPIWSADGGDSGHHTQAIRQPWDYDATILEFIGASNPDTLLYPW